MGTVVHRGRRDNMILLICVNFGIGVQVINSKGKTQFLLYLSD